MFWFFKRIFMNYVDYGEHKAFPLLGSKKIEEYQEDEEKWVDIIMFVFAVNDFINLSLVEKQLYSAIIIIVFAALIILINIHVLKESKNEIKALILKDTFLYIACFSLMSLFLIQSISTSLNTH